MVLLGRAGAPRTALGSQRSRITWGCGSAVTARCRSLAPRGWPVLALVALPVPGGCQEDRATGVTQTASGVRGCRGGCGSCSNPRPRDCSSCPSAPRGCGQVPRSPSGTAEPDPVGPEAGRGAEPHRSSRLGWVFDTGTSSGPSSAPSRSLPFPGWDRDTAVCLSPCPSGSSWSTGAGGELVQGSTQHPAGVLTGTQAGLGSLPALAGRGAGGSALLLAAPAAACSSGILLKWK